MRRSPKLDKFKRDCLRDKLDENDDATRDVSETLSRRRSRHLLCQFAIANRGNIIVAEGDERVPGTSASGRDDKGKSRKEENEVDKGYSSWVRSLRGLSSILDIGPDNGPSS